MLVFAGVADTDEPPLLCDRCLAELTPGKGNFYVVRIEAVADPTPPVFSDEDLSKETRREIDQLIAQLQEYSEQELIDQVYRRVNLALCSSCYAKWIENPTG